MGRSRDPVVLALNILLGHLIGDFLLQPGWMVAAKRRGLVGLLAHTGAIILCTGIVVIRELQLLWAIVLLAGAAHLLVEVATITARRRLAVSGATLFVLDQALHVVSLAGLVWLAGPNIRALATSTFGLVPAPDWVALAVATLSVTLLGSILVFEVGVALGVERRSILPYDRSRVAGMAERAASLVAAVAVHPVLVIVPFIPRLVAPGAAESAARRRRAIDALVGAALSVMAYYFIIVIRALTG